MSLIVEKKIGKTGKLGVWKIEEPLHLLLQTLKLTDKEKFKLETLKHDSKKTQWICCKKTLEHLLEKEIEIAYDTNGKPFINESNQHISFSHTTNYSAVIIDELPTGIDIEMNKPKILSIASKFLDKKEIATLNHQPKESIIRAHIYWGAKEALYKLYGNKQLIFAENLKIGDFDHSPQTGQLQGSILINDVENKYKLEFQKIKDSILVYIINE